MGVFRTGLGNDDAFINGIGRFDIETTGADGPVIWSQSTYSKIDQNLNFENSKIKKL